MDLIIGKEEKRGVILVRCNGELDTFNCGQLRSAIVETLDEGKYKIVIDLQEIEYINSTGLNSLVHSLRRIEEHGGKVILNANRDIRQIFLITGLDQIFFVTDSEEEAIERVLDTKLTPSR